MIVATLKEIKDNENRVGITPSGVKELKKYGHRVIVQENAGIGAGFANQEYIEAGAEMMSDPSAIVPQLDILVKVKEPLMAEYPLLALMKGKTLFTYLHLSGVDPELTTHLLNNQITGVAYETVVDKKGGLPLLSPMSEVAGVLAIQYGAEYLQKKYNGRAITLGIVHNTDRAKVVIIGGGVVGARAAMTAGGMGAEVKIFDIKDEVLLKLKKQFAKEMGKKLASQIEILKSTPEVLNEAIKNADLLVGAVLVPGAKAPTVVSEAQIKSMKKGAVAVDVSIDQGGCIWGSKATSHSHPIYEIEGKIFCCVANMPGQVARQSTQALTNATLPYLLNMANKGILKALKKNERFARGLNTYNGNLTYKSVAEDLKLMEKFVEFAA